MQRIANRYPYIQNVCAFIRFAVRFLSSPPPIVCHKWPKNQNSKCLVVKFPNRFELEFESVFGVSLSVLDERLISSIPRVML